MALSTVADSIASIFGRQRPPLISPEEALLRLLPYLLSTQRVPVGVHVLCTKVWTPATLVFETEEAYLPMRALSAIERQGIITSVAQVFNVEVAGIPTELTFRLLTMNSNAAVQHFVDGGVHPFDRLR